MPAVWIVVPCFNEGNRLSAASIETYLTDHSEIALCLVDDGSRDGTRALLQRIASTRPDQVTVLALDANRGKAEAVRRGVLHGLARPHVLRLGYWDADLSTPLSELALLIRALDERPGGLAALGARVKRLGARVIRSETRHYLGRVFATCASITLRLPVYDSQCGAKLFEREAAAAAFSEPFVSTWLFDVEVLARLRNRFGNARVRRDVLEVPLQTWTHVGGSKLRLRHYLKAPLELARIARRYNRTT